jgi:uncharacterized membrane protein YqjE
MLAYFVLAVCTIIWPSDEAAALALCALTLWVIAGLGAIWRRRLCLRTHGQSGA